MTDDSNDNLRTRLGQMAYSGQGLEKSVYLKREVDVEDYIRLGFVYLVITNIIQVFKLYTMFNGVSIAIGCRSTVSG